MKTIFIYIFVWLITIYFSTTLAQEKYPDISDMERKEFLLSSNDTSLVDIFNWAIQKSNQYVGDEKDPVGAWYEAALPAREAFCMRDVSHQCVGEELNGHGYANANMMNKFVQHISRSKDYCSYWEINRYNLPAPVDYASDSDFWYNLNANFDVLQACLKLYRLTGNRMYITDKSFDDFYRLTLNEYVDHWLLGVDEIMNRPAVMHEDKSVLNPRFRGVRGLPSYEESVGGLRVTGDLIAVIYRGFRSYAEILRLRGDSLISQVYDEKAKRYEDMYRTIWWNDDTRNYYAYKIGDHLVEGGCNVYPLWFGIVREPERIKRLLSILEVKETNVESMSYYPSIFYRYAWNETGYQFLHALYQNERRDYPEVASGLIEGIVFGLAGVEIDASVNRITTLPRLTSKTEWISVENIPFFFGKISIIHHSFKKTSLINKSEKELTWRVKFPVNVESIHGISAKHETDIMGQVYSFVDILCKPNQIITVNVCRGK